MPHFQATALFGAMDEEDNDRETSTIQSRAPANVAVLGNNTADLPIRASAVPSQSVGVESQLPAKDEHETKGRYGRRIQIKNRRKFYLDTHPEYFSADLELADPLLYDRLIRRFQSTAERETEGRKKGFSGTLEADIVRSEAKVDALANPDSGALFNYKRGPNGEILAEEEDEVPLNKEEAHLQWKEIMEWRFLCGEDKDFNYESVDDNEKMDDRKQMDQDDEDEYFDSEEPSWDLEDGVTLQGETGVQDF